VLKVPFSALVLELESSMQAGVPVLSKHSGNLSRPDPPFSLQQEQAEAVLNSLVWCLWKAQKRKNCSRKQKTLISQSYRILISDEFVQSSWYKGSAR